MSQIRLNKFLSDAGLFSRRHADSIITSGQIKVNGCVVAELGTKVNPAVDKVEYQGKLVKPGGDFIYYALYKPKGVVSSANDEQGRQTVTDLLPQTPRVYPVGRLDKDSEGLMILTNDGQLTLELTHPSHEHEKEYEVTVGIQDTGLRKQQNIENYIISALEKGLIIDGKMMKMDQVAIKQLDPVSFILYSVLHTGFNRQIRKMCAKIGLEVQRLIRVRTGKLSLASLNLKEGEYKQIGRDQIV